MQRFPPPALLAPLALAAALAAASPAAAENASADLLPGDRLHGNIVAPGDSDSLHLHLPGGTLLSVDLAAERGSLLLPGLAVLDPEGAPLDIDAHASPGRGGVGVRVRNLPVGPPGGTFTLVVTGTGSTAGKYLLRTKARFPRKWSGDLEIPAGGFEALGFEAVSGSAVSFVVKPARGTPSGEVAADGLRAPDDSFLALEGLKGRRVPLDQDGAWSLEVRNDGDAPATASVRLSVAPPKASRRDLFLSPFGFGEAPRVTAVNPSRVLDDRIAGGVEILGTGFDPAVSVRLERKGETLLPSSLVVGGGGSLTVDFDPRGASSGGWTLVVENPSGGAGTRRFAIQAAGRVKLPAGIQEGAEVWYLDFDRRDFRDDLAAMGFGSTSPTMVAVAEAAVKSYALFYARAAFGAGGSKGSLPAEAVPVCFVLGAPPATVGAPGETYNRLRIGGSAVGGDPSSNPNYPWGFGPLDTGNAAFEDLAPETAAGYGLRSRALAPSLAGSTPGWLAALAPLLDTPLTDADLPWFGTTFVFDTPEQGARYRAVTAAVEAAGKELGGTIAHFVARSMGLPDGVSGLSAVPTQVGGYAGLVNFSFTAGEVAQLKASVRPGLPGRSKTLTAAHFPYRETRSYLLPDSVTATAYAQAFSVAGGRPNRGLGEVTYDLVGGALPPGFGLLATGSVSGTAPLRDGAGQLVGGVFRFVVRGTDSVTREEFFFAHRINLLVDVNNAALSPAEKALGGQKNAQTVATP